MSVCLVLLLFSLYLIWRFARGTKTKANAIEALIVKLGQHDLRNASPVCLENPPAAIIPLLNAVNDLLQRCANTLASEQQFAAFAAHQIKTPLTGIRAQAQMAKRAKTGHDLQESLQMVMAGVDQATRVLDQLQDMTRMEGLLAEQKAKMGPVNLQSVYLQVLPELRSLMYGRDLHLIDATQSHWLEGEHFGIYLILRNLITNAILYTPEHGVVEVSTSIQQGQLVLCVDDSGSGIAEADRQRVFERYCRLNRFGNEGVGLGLYIVKQAVSLHHGSITLMTSPHGGLRAQVTFLTAVQPI